MPDEIIIESKPGYIHVRHYGRDSREISMELWRRIVAACEEFHCFNILGETHTTNRLSVADNYEHATILKAAGITIRHRIAWIVPEATLLADAKFIETVLLNRGLASGKLFGKMEEAKAWLLAENNP